MILKAWDGSGKSVSLDDVPTKHDAKFVGQVWKRSDAEARTAELLGEFSRLQELMYAAGTHSILIVLQGRDTAGKDGALKAVAGAIDPVGCRVASFKVPTEPERAHDFLWRVHAQTPGKGECVFFNRSHYEDVLVVRVHKLAPKSVWEKRYAHINAFEKLVADSNTIVLKFLLHISAGEQEKRLREREAAPETAWKLNVGDWKEREFWDDYTDAYDDMLKKCSTQTAPWHVVPADEKWFRNLAIADAVVARLRPFQDDWESSLKARGDEQRALIKAYRAEKKPKGG